MKFLIGLVLIFSTVSCNPIQLRTQCGIPLWISYLSRGSREASIFLLNDVKKITPLDEYSVQIWGKTNCSDVGDNCETGDCESYGCAPATLVEIAFGVNGHLNFYDVSLANGFNLPISVAPLNSSSENHVCGTAKCEKNLNDICPDDLKVLGDNGETIACLNACARFQSDIFCCSAGNSTQTTCTNSDYSDFFKQACPDAFSYEYDDEATFYCSSDDPEATYEIVFCP